ncbi:hypothetical protein A7U60_g3525 [Sanghuangporus baumii]|uniref:C2H2-type domain-containing protein n=1 Tax=Sanghuangporus baumii TaxID=108892 RepID=A0A9Q5I0L4_SANBA|nr:hypothetical protein A7U60_g3525 [Sanghuangporus baumii]
MRWLLISKIILSSGYVLLAQTTTTFVVPSAAPSSAVTVDPSLLSVSIEFFAFPGYTELSGTTTCLANIEKLRGAPPAVRIGGTTQDRATFDANLAQPVNYTVASPADAPTTLTYGPSFFTLAGQLAGDVTIGLNRQLNNLNNTRAGAEEAVQCVTGLLALELGNEPDLYSSSSPIAGGASWTPATDGASQKSWFTDLSSSVIHKRKLTMKSDSVPKNAHVTTYVTRSKYLNRIMRYPHTSSSATNRSQSLCASILFPTMSKEHLDLVMELVGYVLERAASGDSIPDKPGSLGELRRTLLRKLEELPLSSREEFFANPSAQDRQLSSAFQAAILSSNESHPDLHPTIFRQESTPQDSGSVGLETTVDDLAQTWGFENPSRSDILTPFALASSLDSASIMEWDSRQASLSGGLSSQEGMKAMDRSSACLNPAFIELDGCKATLNVSRPSEPRPQQWLSTQLGLVNTVNNGDPECIGSFVISQVPGQMSCPKPGERYALTQMPCSNVECDFNFSMSQGNVVAQMAPPLELNIQAQASTPAGGSHLANNGQPRTFGSQFAPSYHGTFKRSSTFYLPIAESSHRPARSLKGLVEIGLYKNIPLQLLSPSLEFMPNLPSPPPMTVASERIPLGASGYVNTARNSQGDDVAPRPLKRKRATSPATSKFPTGIRCRLPGCNKPNFEFASIRERNKHEKCAKAHSTSLPSCGICRKVLSRDDAVRRHMELIHGKENEDISWLEQPADREEA